MKPHIEHLFDSIPIPVRPWMDAVPRCSKCGAPIRSDLALHYAFNPSCLMFASWDVKTPQFRGMLP